MKNLKNKIYLLLLWQSMASALPDIPSFSNCPDIIHNSGFQMQSIPSNGVGGQFPYNGSKTIVLSGTAYTYFLYVPSQYQTNKPMPVVALLEPQAVAGQNEAVAEMTHDSWTATAEAYQFITITQVSTGSSGGWIPYIDSQVLNAIFNQVQADYNVEESRRYLWGFSAGAHVGMAIALENAGYFAAFAVNAGVLSNYAGSSAPFSASRNIPFYQSVGDVDPLYPDAQTDRLNFISAGWLEFDDYILDTFVGGHIWPNDADDKAANFLCDKSVYD